VTDTEQALVRLRDEKFADLVCFSIALAAERYPEELRTALEKVFSLEAVREHIRDVSIGVRETLAAATEARALLHQVHLDIEEMEKRMDAIRYALEHLPKPSPNGAARVTAFKQGT
jgi:uncharacterized membrane protein